MARRDEQSRCSLRALFFSLATAAALLGAGTTFQWRADATLLFALGVIIVWYYGISRFPHRLGGIAVGLVICLFGTAVWAFTDDVVGDLRRSKDSLKQLKQEMVKGQP